MSSQTFNLLHFKQLISLYSTVSSALNSLSALITEDFVKRYWPGKSDIVLGNMSKIISVATGLIAFLLVFVMKTVNETIQIAPVWESSYLAY